MVKQLGLEVNVCILDANVLDYFISNKDINAKISSQILSIDCFLHLNSLLLTTWECISILYTCYNIVCHCYLWHYLALLWPGDSPRHNPNQSIFLTSLKQGK